MGLRGMAARPADGRPAAAWPGRAVHRQGTAHVSGRTAARGGADEPARLSIAESGRGVALPAEGRARAGGRDRGAARRARRLQRASAGAARMADAAGCRSRAALELFPPAIGRRGGVRPAGRRVAGECDPAVVPAALPAAGGYLLELVHDLHAARLGAVVALARREAHLGADRQALEVVVLHAVAVEIHLPVVAPLAQEAVALLEQLLDDALLLAVVLLGVLFHLAAAQLGGLFQLALDRAEREVDERRQLLRHVVDHFALLRRQVLVRRHARLHQHAVAIAIVVRGLLLGERDTARGDAVREALQPLHALEDIAFHPGGAIDVVEDEFRIGLHTRSNPRAGASSRERPLQRDVPRPCGA